MFYFQKTQNKGFTLIEILVSIAIIGILSTMIFANLNSSRVKSRDARRKMDLDQLVNAITLYADNNAGYFPLSDNCGNPRVGQIHSSFVTACPEDGNNFNIGSFFVNNKYTSGIISDPRGGTTQGCRYYYYTDPTGKYYQFSAYLENPSVSDIQSTTNGVLPNWGNCPMGNYRVTGSF